MSKGIEQTVCQKRKNVKFYLGTVKTLSMAKMGDDECSWDDPLESEYHTREPEKVINVKSIPEQPIFGLHISDIKLKINDAFKNLEVFTHF